MLCNYDKIVVTLWLATNVHSLGSASQMIGYIRLIVLVGPLLISFSGKQINL